MTTWNVCAEGEQSDASTALQRALAEARALEPGHEREILLAGGTYYLDEPLTLTPDDSNLTLRAAAGAEAILCGGRAIHDWRAEDDGTWSAPVPQAKDGTWDFRALVVNGRLAPRARLPEEGFFEHESTFDVRWMSTTGGGWQRKPTEAELTTMVYCPGDLGEWLDPDNAEITVYHMWDESMVGVKAIDHAARTVTFSTPAGHPPGAFGVKKYEVWNVRQGLTRPGQWFLDRTGGRVVYRPLEGEELARVRAVAPVTESVVRIRGTEDRPVANVTLRGLTLTVTNTPLVAGGFGAGRFAGALDLEHTRDVRLERLDIRSVAGQGLKAARSTGLVVAHCRISQTGACGISANAIEDGLLRDSRIHDTGLLYPSAPGVRWSGKRNRVEHNEVRDTSYSGIISSGESNTFEANRISRVMKVLHDGAAIYVTFCKGMVLRGNWVSDIVDTGGYGASAYYLDEQAEDCLVEDNLSVGVVRPSHNHMARNNVIRHNVFLSDENLLITLMKCEGFRFEHNVLVARKAVQITGTDAIADTPNNVLFSRKGQYQGGAFDGKHMGQAAPLEVGEGTVFSDPMLVRDGEGIGWIRYRPDSPVGEAGIRPLDVRTAGPREPKPE